MEHDATTDETPETPGLDRRQFLRRAAIATTFALPAIGLVGCLEGPPKKKVLVPRQTGR